MTDQTHRFLALDGTMGRLYMSIDCPNDAYRQVQFMPRGSRDTFYTSGSNNLYVSTRFDKEPARSMERWSGTRGAATLPHERTEDFVASLQAHQALLVTVYQEVGDSYEETFDLTGAEAGLERFAQDCLAD